MAQAKITAQDKQIIDDVLKNAEYFRRKLIAATGKQQPVMFTYKELLWLMTQFKHNMFNNKQYTNMSGKRRFTKFVYYCLERNKANFDTMILLTGSKGGGKSSTAIQLARAWCKLLGIKFSCKMHMAYNNADVMEKCDKLEKFHPLIADEAIRFATSENWNKAENKDLKMKLGQIRTKHLFYILCFPLNVTKLDKTYLNDYVNYWIHLFARGKGVLFVKDENLAKDPWNLKALENVGSWNEFTTPDIVERKLMNHPNFWKVLHIPKVPKPVYDRYLEVREYNVYNDDSVRRSLTKQDFNRAALLLVLESIMTKDKTLSMKRIIMFLRQEFGYEIDQKGINDIMVDSKKLLEVYKKNYAEFSNENKNHFEVKEEELENANAVTE